MDKAKQALETLGKVVPVMSDAELERLIAFGQGMAFKASQNEGSPPLPQRVIPGRVRLSA